YHLVACPFENQLKELTQVLAVVDDENASFFLAHDSSLLQTACHRGFRSVRPLRRLIASRETGLDEAHARAYFPQSRNPCSRRTRDKGDLPWQMRKTGTSFGTKI